ncbi:hypothetical protein HED51_01290 [Ochrobactrum grignonense]|nr:hypothetical protein [Brucella grignonensis]
MSAETDNYDVRFRIPAGIALRVLLFTAVFTGPVATFAYTQIGQKAHMSGVGLVLYVSLQRSA